MFLSMDEPDTPISHFCALGYHNRAIYKESRENFTVYIRIAMFVNKPGKLANLSTWFQ